MPGIWAAFQENEGSVLAMIMSCYFRASILDQNPNMIPNMLDEYPELFAAEELLRKHFSAFLINPARSPPDHIIERNDQMKAMIASLECLRYWLRHEKGANSYFAHRFSPMSQKKSSKMSTFSVMLGNEFTQYLGQPFNDRVRVIAEALYYPEETTMDAVRMKLKRDRDSRKESGLKPWISADDRNDLPDQTD
jgi:hypothetical protein